MPVWDLTCSTCGWSRLDAFLNASDRPTCPDGHEATRVIFPGAKGPTMIPDSIPGGRVVENLSHEPITVYSKSELKREMEARGLESFVRHTGTRDGDRSPHTSRWV